MILVNKKKKLKRNYIPKLVKIYPLYSDGDQYLTKEAKNSFEKLCLDALEVGYHIIAVSTYRNYDYQKKLYKHYVKTKGKKYANVCSAKAGHSEHQTGLAVDVANSSLDYDNFDQTNEFEWMKNNAHKYGFILRYPKDKTSITGYKYEPWHYRYVGKDIAHIIYQKKITLEEYIKTTHLK